MKAIFILTLLFTFSARAQDEPQDVAVVEPTLEAVPAPTVEKTAPVDKTDKEADLGLIKTEKSIKAKNCRMVRGELKCKHKKKPKKKTI